MESLLNGLSPEQIKKLLDLQSIQSLQSGPQSDQSLSVWDPSSFQQKPKKEVPKIPEVPELPSQYQNADIGGFAGYAMDRPELKDPMAQINNIMGMALGGNINRPTPKQAPNQSALLAYLQSLGV